MKFRRTLIGGGVRENRVLQAAFSLTVDVKLLGIISMHVDALLYGFFDGPVGQIAISHIKQHFEIIRVQLLFLWQGSAPGPSRTETIPSTLRARQPRRNSVRTALRAAPRAREESGARALDSVGPGGV